MQVKGEPMGRPIIVVVDANKEQCEKLCSLLEQEDYETVGLHSLPNLEKTVRKTSRSAVILDLDSMVVDNRFIKDFKKQHPDVPIMALSSSSYHPELEQSMRKMTSRGRPVLNSGTIGVRVSRKAPDELVVSNS